VHETNDAVTGAGQGDGGAGSGSGQATAVFRFAVVLTVSSGAMNVAAFTRLGNVFASVMTGNLVLLGLAAERVSASLATRSVVAFAGYVVGVAAGARLAPHGQPPRGRLRHVVPALLAELALLAGFTAGWELTRTTPHGGSQLALLAVAAAAMGTQSAAARALSSRVATTYLTGTLTTVVAALVNPGARQIHWREAAQLLAMAVGAAAGGLVIAAAPAALPAIPLAAILLVIAGDSGIRMTRRSDRRQPVARGRLP
jgi:uncharacterized membrane protein YoaK (UPF0700 family)